MRIPVLVFAALAGAVAQAQPGAQQGSPDLSGVWNMQNTPQTRYLAYTFSAQDPSMTPWAEERFKLNKPSFGPHAVEDSNDPVNPTTINALGCFPPGVPRIYLQPFPMEIIQTPGRVLMVYEFSHLIRQIFTDGRKHNTDLGATWMGDSIGKWEGDTLVVDTIGFNDKTWLDRAGHPHSTELHVTERIRRPDRDTLQIAVNMEDPKAYTKPWGGNLTYKLRPTWNITEMICEDNVNFDAFLKNEVKPAK
ncbi:MAG: hypothetical protein JOZ22_22445 [Acidobacteriia bacterium]|nr:hypothetical protein [Terriglobia bacterium]